MSNQKEYRFDKNGGTDSSADSTNTNVTVNGDKNAFYGTTDKDIELVDGYFTANTWYRPKEILKDGKEWTPQLKMTNVHCLQFGGQARLSKRATSTT